MYSACKYHGQHEANSISSWPKTGIRLLPIPKVRYILRGGFPLSLKTENTMKIRILKEIVTAPKQHIAGET